MAANSTRKPRSSTSGSTSGSTAKKLKWWQKPGNPGLPYKDFPLSPHASGAWQKKIRGKVHYFGRWARRSNGKMERLPGDGWKEALELYQAQRDDLQAGRTPQPANETDLTVKVLCNKFLNAKLLQMQDGELEPVTFGEYRQICDTLAAEFGKNQVVADLSARDFEKLRSQFAERYGTHRLGNSVQRVRTVFKYGYEAGLLDRPMRFGPQFKKPSAKARRRQRNQSAERLFTAAEIQRLHDAASVPMRAMILLGVNCGFGNSDVANLPMSAVDLDGGWINFPRPKTEVARRCSLWPETVAALRTAIEARTKTACEADKDCVFLTVFGNRWVRDMNDAVALEFGKLLRRLKINSRKGLGFYTLRHTFRTEADATKDFPAVRLVMGHVDGSMDAVYRERIDNDRLVAVADHVHDWLFGGAK